MANPSFLINDSLYCSEDNWAGEVVDVEEGITSKMEDFRPILSENDLYWEQNELPSLFLRQEPNQLSEKLETNPLLAEARTLAVDWILKVNAHYSFTALTSVLAVNYLDMFLFSSNFQTEKPWMTQLAAVACLSLAAKVEETQVPLLLDLQVHLIQLTLNHCSNFFFV